MDIKKFKAELKALLEKYDVTLGVDIDGDTYGIENTNFEVCGNKAPWTEFILNEHESYISSGDLN